MYSSNPSSTEQYSHAPPPFAQATVTGVPMNSTSQYHENSQPASFQAPVPWSSGLYDCCHDVSNCCLTCWCPCITFGRIADIVDKGSKTTGFSEVVYALIANLIGCGCLYSYPYRTKIRQQYMLEEKPCGDCLVHFCCEPCALCQEYRELEARGFDMTIGWKGNVEKRTGGVMATTAPVFQGSMNR
ncbi:hypothetical protein ACJW31_03G080300 [Castanea mollissima]